MLGAITGDVIGSVFEARPIKTTDFPLFDRRSTFTDDTVLTVAVAHAVLEGSDYASALRRFGRRYPAAGYGGAFYNWIFHDSAGPYDSWGNGSAMRVSPVGHAFQTMDEVLAEAQKSAEVTHNHPEGIKGAQATALAVFLARSGEDKDAIRRDVSALFDYDLDRSLDGVRDGYAFDVSCQGSVPESILAFLESTSFEDAVRKAISLGGDSDTMAAIAGAIAEAYYGEVPERIAFRVRQRLPEDLLAVVDKFTSRYG